MVSFVHSLRRRAWRLRNIAWVALALLAVACGDNSPTKRVIDAVSQEQAEELRDTCVADSLALLQALGDRIAPLARASGIEELEATALSLGCSFETTTDGYRLLCPTLDLRGSLVAVELNLHFADGDTVLEVIGSDATRVVHGTLTLSDDSGRGLVLQGAMEAINENGCRAVAEFDELIGLEAYGLTGDVSTLYFREGAVALTVYRDDALALARGSAALTGRDAFVVLNFDEFSLWSEMSFPR